MTDLQDQIAQIRERLHLARKASIELYMAGVRPPQIDRMGSSADDVPRLVAALEAVHNVVENYPLPHWRDDPTGEIACAIEMFGDAIQDAYTDKLTGEDDD